jgi:hypothetical protein
MSVEPAPTIVVGVGQAGINVINRIHESDGLGWGDEYDKYFDYIAIDSSSNEVRNSPDKATQVDLQSPRRNIKTDQRAYPYLTENLQIGEKGAQRQRPVGRYKLDNTDMPSWDAHYEKISNAIESHMRTCRQDPDINAKQVNVVHVHSLGGGTGSGTFPLIAHMLNEITGNLSGSAGGMNIYTAGVGVVPEIMHNLDAFSPPGDNRYYANAYAALKDLEKLIDADKHDPLPIYLYSKIANLNEGLTTFNIDRLDPQEQVTSSPYRHYFLIGVDEDQIDGDNKQGGPETYRSMVNNTMMSAIYGLSMYGNEIENWFETAEGNFQFGSFGQTQLRVPIEDVRAYCSLNERIEELRGEVEPEDEEREGDLVDRRKEKISKRETLEAILEDPTEILKEYENSEAIRGDVAEQVERRINSGNNVIETTSEDIDAIVDELRESYGDRIVAYAMDRAEERIESEGAGIREAWREVVNSKYKQLEVASEDGYGHNVTTTSEKVGELQRFLDDKIEELEQAVEEEAEEDGGLFDIDIFGGGPDYQEWLEAYRAHKEDLNGYQRNRDQLRALKQEVRSRRANVLQDTIRPRVDRLNDEIEELRERIEEKEDDLGELIEDREDKLDELTDAEYGGRIGRLALDEGKLRDDLDRETLEEELTSLSAFHEEGYLARDLGEQIEGRIGQSYAWDSTLMSWDDEAEEGIGNRATAVRDIWMLHSDENANLPEFDITGAGRHEFRRSGDEEDDVFPSFEDPYTVQFLSYTLDSPLTSLQVYTELDRAAEEGWLDAIIDVWDDYRLAFAYPEWYGREIQKVFAIETSTELPELPELDETKITVEKESGELKAWISSHGLASYLWNGDEWDDFNGYITVDGHEYAGWKHYLSEEYGLTYNDMRDVVPSGRTAELWHAGEITWEEFLAEVQENLIEKHGVEVKLTRG